ncbi:MAG: Coq4 family protein [Ilumatobacteraceae bacterium]
MPETFDRTRFERIAQEGGDRALTASLAVAVRSGAEAAAADLAALLLHVATIAPEALPEYYDGAAEGWTGRAPSAEPIIVGHEGDNGAMSDAFWPAFWALVLDPEVGRNAGEITVRTAALTALMSPAFGARLATTALHYPGVAAALAVGDPQPFTMAQLTVCPKGSLGGDLHDLIVDNSFDLEVLPRDQLALSTLPVPLGYLNSRILQCHDLWHLLAGYDTTILHEVAISAFQLAQFGHHYSSVFLAVTVTKVALSQPAALELMLDTILSGWTHGRETPPLLGLPWEAIWHEPIETIRATHGVAAFASPYPANLLELLLAG